jgi:cation diffusion facilitator family transporter
LSVENKQQVKKVLILAFALNLTVSIFKMIYGLWTGTLTMIGDGVHSLTDGIGSLMGIVSVDYASRPSDHDHHYGHRKYETLAAIAIAALVALAGWEMFRRSVSRLVNPSASQYHDAGLWIMIATILINFLLSRYEKKKSEQYNSQILRADSAHTASDIWVSFSVIVSLVALKFNIQWIDTVFSICISFYFAYVAITLIRPNLLILTDAAFLDVQTIKNLALKEEGVISCHRVRTRGIPTHAYVDLHIQVAPEMTTIVSHRLAHNIERRIKDEIPGIIEVLVHTEPFPDDDED